VLAAFDGIYIPTDVAETTESGLLFPKTLKIFPEIPEAAWLASIPTPVRTFIESVVRPLNVAVTLVGAALEITFTDSWTAVDVKLIVKVTDADSPTVTETALALIDNVEVVALRTAADGPVEITPNPNAATNASAMRLNDVDLLVICFLSKVVNETFPFTAGKDSIFTS